MKTLLVSAFMASSLSAATILGFGVEADFFNPSVDGSFEYKSTQTDFSNDSAASYQIGAFIEHPVPLVPNLRLDYTSPTKFEGSNGIGGTNRVSISQLDITPYYEIIDTIVDIDLGVTFKVFDGKIEGTVNENFNPILPMLYVGVAAPIPATPLSIAGNVKYINVSGDSFTDAKVKALWKLAPMIEAQAGYRYESLNVGDRFNFNANTTIKGPFVGLSVNF